MHKRIAVVLSAISGITSLGVQADNTLEFHASGQAVYTQVKTAGETFSPPLFQIKADIEFTDGLMDGIGLQGLVAMPISDDSANGMTLEIDQQSGIYLTLTNPERDADDIKISVLLGYASTSIETITPSLNDKNTETFSDFSWGFSLQDRIVEGHNVYWTLDFLRYYRDDNLRVDGLGFGVTYGF